MTLNSKKITLFGFGTVGKGFYHYLSQNKQENRVAHVFTKQGQHPLAQPFSGKEDSFDETSEIIIELINNEKEALQIVSEALLEKKIVISANKKLIAENLQYLLSIEQKHLATFLYEGAVCGSIPIIRLLNDFYTEEPIQKIKGIFNGSSNYILTQLFTTKCNYLSALEQAQKKGFAEKDPTSDVGGFDALYKLIIITAHAFGLIIKPADVLTIGIESVSEKDICFAKKHGLKIKQIATVCRTNKYLSLSVAPTLVDYNNELYSTEEEYNGVLIESENIGKQFYKGKGAGSLPTGFVVFSDLTIADKKYRYSYSKMKEKTVTLNQNKIVTVLIRTKNIFELPLGFSNSKQIEECLFLANTSLANLAINKENFEDNGLSIIFIDNDNIINQITKHASTVN